MPLSRTSTTIVTYTLTEGNSTLQMNAEQALDALNGFIALQNQIQADNQTTPANNPPPASGFLGIYNFSGPASVQMEKDPNIAGTYLGWPWALIEPTEGSYAWNIIDAQMQPWIEQNKRVILRVSASGWKKWWSPPLAQWCPDWVTAKGVATITDDDGSIKPAYWDPKFLLALQNFIQAFAEKYDGHPNIAAIEMGIGDGGETKVDTEKNADVLKKWEAIGYTDDLWFGAIKEIVMMYTENFKHTPCAIMPDASFIGKTSGLTMSSVMDFAVQQGCWLQDNGLVKGEVFKSPDWTKVPIISEQRNPTSSSGDTLDWDLNQAINVDKARIALVFTQDLTNPKNAATLAKYAALVGK